MSRNEQVVTREILITTPKAPVATFVRDPTSMLHLRSSEPRSWMPSRYGAMLGDSGHFRKVGAERVLVQEGESCATRL